MSDAAKSQTEIEDVLASIRRLVSDTSGTAPVKAERPADASSAPEASGEATVGKLVLTPAQRVTEPDDPWAPVAARPEPSHEATAADGEDGDATEDPSWGLEDRLSDWGEIEQSADEAVADAIAERLSDDGTPAFDPPAEAEYVSEAEATDDLSALIAMDGAAPDEEQSDFESEVGDTDWPGTGADSALRQLAIVRRQHDETDEADAAVHKVEMVSDPVAVTPDPEPVAVTAHEDEKDEMQDDMNIAGDSGFRPVFSRRPAGQGEYAEAVSPGADDHAGAAHDAAEPTSGDDEMQGHDQPANAMRQDDRDTDVEDGDAEPNAFTYADADDGVLDEETLREIVAEIVREELQGVLGQRITRNVRKMVRREIRIALAAEDLE